MDAAVKERWLKALRGGKFKQGFCQLHYGNSYCCLGVLAKIEGMSLEDSQEGMSQPSYRALAELIGTSPSGLLSLTKRNDGEGQFHSHSFRELADFIEKKF